ncbi:hypothetical protein VNO77_15373 [Canavalia gladiata]|uniref:Uncharacterized protein n=1 Tax=Canavalia gladiata TaxID=3824 RepID=A0AAN9QR73_CANGL
MVNLIRVSRRLAYWVSTRNMGKKERKISPSEDVDGGPNAPGTCLFTCGPYAWIGHVQPIARLRFFLKWSATGLMWCTLLPKLPFHSPSICLTRCCSDISSSGNDRLGRTKTNGGSYSLHGQWMPMHEKTK